MKIACIGSGYVGLVTAVMLADLGHDIICLDKDVSKIDKLSSCETTIFEKDLDTYLAIGLKTKKLRFTSEYNQISYSEVIFICVGTPSQANGKADLSYVIDSIIESTKYISSSALIVIKSTVTPGTCKILESMLKKMGYKNKIASNPEFLREGSAISDFQNPDRIIFGGDNSAIILLRKIYEPLIVNGIKTVETDTTTSELIKHASNSFLAVKLSFINEMANLCEKIDADVDTLSLGMGLDKRIGTQFLKSGPGFGGSCFPKDTLALSNLSKEEGVSLSVLEASINSNLHRYELMKNKIISICGKNKNLAILGVAFKAGTDDVRESPAVHIIELLASDGFCLRIFDPVAMQNFIKLGIKNATHASSIFEACENADAIVILTEWEEFTEMDLEKIGKIVSNKLLVDLRKVVKSSYAKKHGFKYFTIGRSDEVV